MADPARAAVLTFTDRRDIGADVCNKIPCNPVRKILMGSKGDYPPCVVCIFEDRIRRKHNVET